MSLESVSSDRPDEPDPKDDGDEAIISMSVSGEVTDTSIVEVGRSRPQFQYSREELMEIKTLPLAKRRPECLDVAYNNSRGIWEPERWQLDRKRSETPPEEEQRAGGKPEPVPETQSKRKSGDPRERIRKEQDGIVLSPQRRSFNTGCFVNVTQPPPRRPESPIGKSEVPHREPVRRIGSGRLLARDMWDFRPETEKMEPERADFSFRSGGNASTRERDVGRDRERDNIRESHDRNERFERRPFGRDFGDRDGQRDRGSDMRNERGHPMDRDKDRGGRMDRKYGNDRRRTYEHREAEEPEWFSSGPISQHDTIELRGFDDIPEEKSSKSKKTSVAQKKRSKKSTSEKDEKSSDNSAGPKGRSTPTVMDRTIEPVAAPHSPISKQNDVRQTSGMKERPNDISAVTEISTVHSADGSKTREGESIDFNLDDFLKSDNVPGVSGLLTNGVSVSSGSGSRFSQWFKRDSPQDDSHGPSIQDELLNNLLNDITEPNIHVPSVTESNAYFAPISPANPSSTINQPPGTGTKLLELLQRGNKINQNGDGDPANVIQMMKNSNMKDRELAGKVMHSVEELEARMRGNQAPPKTVEPPRSNTTEEDLSAFNKLLAQVSGGQAVPAANGPNTPKAQQISANLMQLLKSQQAQPAMPVGPHPPLGLEQTSHPPVFNHAGPLGPAQHPHQAQMQHENLLKVLRIQQQQQQQQQKQRQQQQSDMLSMMLCGAHIVGSPVPPDMQMLVNNAPSSRELLQRPEALAIIQGLQQGEITRQHLIQQLQNPAMQHRHREVLVNILKMYGNTTPRAVSPHAGPSVQHDPMMQQLLYQQQQQQRVPSPMNNALCPPAIISSNLSASPNTLSIQHPVMPHRVPSPRDLVMHTQSIMQNALIKTKLEEQREKYRKQQEQHIQQQHHQQQQKQQQQQQRITSPANSPSKQMMSPTPLAFTPTSVLRRLTAEKEPDGNGEPSKLTAQNQATQLQQVRSAFQILASGSLPRQQNTLRSLATSQQPQWSSQPVNKHPGRPIVKGGVASQFPYAGPMNFPQQQQPQQPQPSPAQRPITSVFGNTARSKHTMSTSLSHSNVPSYNMTPNSIMSQRSDPVNNQIKVQQAQSHLASIHQQQRSINSQVQHVLNQNYNSSRTDGRIMRPQQQPMGMPMGRQASPGSNGGSLSPTSNQLARWFTSPELLAKAKAVKLPELGQLSLAELERLQQASTAVHD